MHALIAAAAAANGLPSDFFLRLLRQESGLNPNAVSPVGALGIAQFMPGTAAERGLRNPFDPLEAIPKSAELLREHRARFGNLGLAAAAYNAGPQRVRGWLEGRSGMPAETRDYVARITGRTVEEWAAESGRSFLSVPPLFPAPVVSALWPAWPADAPVRHSPLFGVPPAAARGAAVAGERAGRAGAKRGAQRLSGPVTATAIRTGPLRGPERPGTHLSGPGGLLRRRQLLDLDGLGRRGRAGDSAEACAAFPRRDTPVAGIGPAASSRDWSITGGCWKGCRPRAGCEPLAFVELDAIPERRRVADEGAVVDVRHRRALGQCARGAHQTDATPNTTALDLHLDMTNLTGVQVRRCAVPNLHSSGT